MNSTNNPSPKRTGWARLVKRIAKRRNKAPMDLVSTGRVEFEHLIQRIFTPHNVNGEPTKVLALTSRTPREGVSTISCGLVQSLAAFANDPKSTILLIDASNRVSSLATDFFLLDEAKPINDAESIAEHTQPLLGGKVDLLTIGTSPDLLFNADNQVWEALKHQYEYIIVDVGSWSTKTPHIWAKYVDSLVLIHDVTNATKEMLERFRQEVAQAKCQFSGFIMNKRQYHIPAAFYRLIS